MAGVSAPRAQGDASLQPRALLLGTAEWDAPIATNQHYVARELAKAADVTFVESLGLRRPTLSRNDLARMASRVRRAAGGANLGIASRALPDRTEIVSPLVLPVHRKPTYRLNRALLRRAARRWLEGVGLRVLWAFTPTTYGLESAADLVVYHCVDLLGTFPGVDAIAVERAERLLAARDCVAIATSDAVQRHLHATGFTQVNLLANVADVAVFETASRSASERKQRVLFAGNLTTHKLDVDLLVELATSLKGHGELLLAGPLAAGGGSFDAELQRLERAGARYLGVLTPQQLAEVAGECMVGLIPYANNDYTRGVSPLKCYEYLSSGMAVLSTRLPSVDEVARSNQHVITAGSAEVPMAALQLLNSVTDETIAARMASAGSHSWEARGSLLRDLMASELQQRISG